MKVYQLVVAHLFAATTVACAFQPGVTQQKLSSRPQRLQAPFSDSTKTGMMSRRSSSRLFVGGAVEAWDAYNTALEANPLLVKSVTAGIILGAADLAGQAFEKQQQQEANNEFISSEIDWARVSRFAIFGLVLQAPWNHFYYLLLDNQIPPTEQPFSPTNTIKICIDQFVQAPIFTVLIFVFLGLLEGKQTDDIQRQLKNDYKDTIIANCKPRFCVRRQTKAVTCLFNIVSPFFSPSSIGKLWIPATVINIGFVPPILRVLYLNGVFFVWCIYLSLVLNKAEEE